MSLARWLAYQVWGTVKPKPRRRKRRIRRGPARSAQYRAWIRSLPCASCGVLTGIETCHTGPHALGQKSSDFHCIPLCRFHHREGNDALDKIGRRAFEERWEWNIDDLVRQLNAEWREQRG